jgi:hypothetical protein
VSFKGAHFPSMNRSVVIHHNTAWWRSHSAPSRCISGSARRQRPGSGGKRVAWATPSGMILALSKLQPQQKPHGQHHGDGMAVKAWPQPTLLLIPAQFPCGLLMELLNGMAAMDILDQFLQRHRGRQGAPRALGLFGLSLSCPLPQQPADAGFTLCGQTTGPQRHTLLAQPALGAKPPTHGAPLTPRYGGQHLVGPLTGWRATARHTHLKITFGCAQLRAINKKRSIQR